ncbi:hypothetical protein [Streptomyces flavofungini]|uniref:Uncharacterized protein n=1 Tax=Streptomyces flavofungini TaxID=68200 RepID=A0ABS0X704_9ACTN|nr:hypothetical protein [Streptomyces flavofungini]MBJ3808990.1 hypothetical protein [Streptomyces flavofungini]GHC68016.1 hypothetical protein GCM10010349_41580 [Streptomyces flavofungini]
MTPEWLATLAAAGAAGLVGAAGTDAWQTTRDRFLRLFGRDDPDRTDTAARRLDALRELARRPDAEADLAQARHDWRVLLQRLLAEHPDAAGELQAAIAALAPPGHPTTTTYQQHGRAEGHGRVFMNQHGDLSVRDVRREPDDD